MLSVFIIFNISLTIYLSPAISALPLFVNLLFYLIHMCFHSQCVTRALLRSVVVLLLLANSSGKRRCNYKEILGSYREVIFVELQNLVCAV